MNEHEFRQEMANFIKQQKWPFLGSNEKEKKMNWILYKKHFNTGLDEAFNFMLYYQDHDGKKDGVEISAKMLSQCKEQEENYRKMVGLYGKNKDVWCKYCRKVHPL